MRAELRPLHDHAEQLAWQVRRGTLTPQAATDALPQCTVRDAHGTTWALLVDPLTRAPVLHARTTHGPYHPAHPSRFATATGDPPQLARWELRPAPRDLPRAARRASSVILGVLALGVVSLASAASASVRGTPADVAVLQPSAPSVIAVECTQSCGTDAARTLISLRDDRVRTEQPREACAAVLADDRLVIRDAAGSDGTLRCYVEVPGGR